MVSVFPLCRLDLEAALASRLGERLDAAVIKVAAAVEHNVRNSRLLGPVGYRRSNLLGRLEIAAVGDVERLVAGRRRSQGTARVVVDGLARGFEAWAMAMASTFRRL